MTGGRVLRVRDYLENETFMLTYGDGVADIDIGKLLAFHKSHGKLATVTAVRPPSRFGGMSIEDGLVTNFIEKPQIGEGWINGGFFVLEPGVLDYIKGDSTLFEHEPLEMLAREGQLAAYKHEGFWQCMDTVRDVALLNEPVGIGALSLEGLVGWNGRAISFAGLTGAKESSLRATRVSRGPGWLPGSWNWAPR